MPYCATCGAELLQNPAFCPACGARVATSPVSPSQSPVPPTPPPPVQNTPKITVVPYTLASFWGGLLVVVGFFCTWVSVPIHDGQSTTGLGIFIECIKEIPDNTLPRYLNILTPLAIGAMFVMGMLCLLSSFTGETASKSEYKSFKNIPLIALIAVLILVRISLRKMGLDPDRFSFDAVMKMFGTGLFFCIAGAVVLTFSHARADAKP